LAPQRRESDAHPTGNEEGNCQHNTIRRGEEQVEKEGKDPNRGGRAASAFLPMTLRKSMNSSVVLAKKRVSLRNDTMKSGSVILYLEQTKGEGEGEKRKERRWRK